MSTQYFNPPRPVTPRELQLADRVQLDFMRNSPFNHAVVKKITDDSVILFRPYAHTGDFSCTAGVLCYTGVEEVRLWINEKNLSILLMERRELR